MKTEENYWDNLRVNVAKMRILDDVNNTSNNTVSLGGWEHMARVAEGVEFDLARIADELAEFRAKHNITDNFLGASGLIDATARIYSPLITTQES